MGKKPYLLLDQFILFMLEPGKTHIPDQRCCLRLVRALRDANPAPWLFWLLPLPVRVMLEMVSPEEVEGDLLGGLVRVWWEYNGRSVFFAHNMTAKLVRKMVKNGEAGR